MHQTEDLTCVICNEIFDRVDLVGAHMKDIHNVNSTSANVSEGGQGSSSSTIETADAAAQKSTDIDRPIIASPTKRLRPNTPPSISSPLRKIL